MDRITDSGSVGWGSIPHGCTTMTIKPFITAALLAVSTFAGAHTVIGTFNWADPASLSPAFPAPDASNRYGEYISNVTFFSNGVTLTVDDSYVAQQSQRARFLYGYNTQEVEMRAYMNSDIIINAPENMYVTRVSFAGAKADGYYMTSYDEASSFDGQEWSTTEPQPEARFYVEATINCTKITAICSDMASVNDIVTDDDGTAPQWFTISGVSLNGTPTQPGLYICRKNGVAERVLIR